MRSALQLLGGIAVAGVVAAGSTALTGSGLTTSAPATTFIGGTVTQTITGGSPDLSSIAYHFDDAPANTSVDQVTLVFATTMAARTVSGTLHYGSSSTQSYTCTISSSTATCAISPSVVGLNANDITVS